MASLRAPFVQSFNFNSSSFSAYSAAIPFVCLFSLWEEASAHSDKYVGEKQVNYSGPHYFWNWNQYSANLTIQRFINLNINSLNKIADNSSCDFKTQPTDDFVHVLDIVLANEPNLDQLETVVSLKANGEEWSQTDSTLNSSFCSELDSECEDAC